MRYARDYTREEALAHPWWGVECPHCKAAPGEPCKSRSKAGPYRRIHGQRTMANILDYVDPRPRIADRPPQPARVAEQLELEVGP